MPANPRLVVSLVLVGLALCVGYHHVGIPRASRSTNSTLCAEYAVRWYGADNMMNEISLVQSIVNNTFNKLTVHPASMDWFNGTNNDGSDFIGDPTIQTTFKEHLYGFFALGLGCTYVLQFPAEYLQFNADMNFMHGVGPEKNNFHKPISKDAFELHNQVVCDFLYSLGMDTPDIITVAAYLDSFRTGLGISNNTICQDPGCTESPYAVYVRDNFFLPPYLTVPPGNTVSFIPASTYEHTVTSSPAIADCSSSSGFNIDMPGFFSPPVEVAFDTLGTFPFKDNFYCSTGMYGLINVTTLAENPSPAPSSSDASPSLLSSSWAGLIW